MKNRLSIVLSVTALAWPMCLSSEPALGQQCGDTITQDTTLNNDLINCPVNGLQIGAPDITLDLDGHTIDGEAATAAVGIDNTAGHDRVTIKNGIIREFADGIRLNNADRNRLKKLEVSYNANSGIVLDQSTNNKINENSTSDNDQDGIAFTNSNHNIIEENTTSDNNNDGILLNNSDDNRIEDNSVFDNENFGIAVESGSDRNQIANNEASNNGFANGNSGILVDGNASTNNLVERNDANWNFLNGISAGDATTTLRKNTANNNGQLGIDAVPGVIDGGANKAQGNGNPLQCANVIC
jgi:parallel beta-helix repeat protein